MEKGLLDVQVHFSSLIDRRHFQGKAVSVTSENDLGRFDILYNHSNFITLIYDELIIQTPKGEVDYQFERGVMKVKENRVNIFLGL